MKKETEKEKKFGLFIENIILYLFLVLHPPVLIGLARLAFEYKQSEKMLKVANESVQKVRKTIAGDKD